MDDTTPDDVGWDLTRRLIVNDRTPDDITWTQPEKKSEFDLKLERKELRKLPKVIGSFTVRLVEEGDQRLFCADYDFREGAESEDLSNTQKQYLDNVVRYLRHEDFTDYIGLNLKYVDITFTFK